MQKDIDEAQERLALARHCVDLSQEHRGILCQIIDAEISGSLTGSYSDIPIQVYHHPLCSGYSSTTIKRLVEQSYNHWFVHKGESQALRFGNAFHTYCNEFEIFERDYLIAPTDTKRSPEYKSAKANAEALKKIVLTSSEFRTIEVMSRKLFEHPDAAPLLKGAKNEITFFSQDSATGLWKKCRVDGINGLSIYDLKTTMSAAPMAFSYDCKSFLYRISASYYTEIVTEIYKTPVTNFYLIPCEKLDPWECAVYRVADSSMERGQLEIRESLNQIRTIIDQGEKAWKGYSLGIKDLAI